MLKHVLTHADKPLQHVQLLAPTVPQPKVLKGAGLDFQSLLLSAFVFVHSYILLHSYGVLDKEHCFCAVQGMTVADPRILSTGPILQSAASGPRQEWARPVRDLITPK